MHIFNPALILKSELCNFHSPIKFLIRTRISLDQPSSFRLTLLNVAESDVFNG